MLVPLSFSLSTLLVLANALPHKIVTPKLQADVSRSSFTLQMTSKHSLSQGGNIPAYDKLRLQQMRSTTKYATPHSVNQNSQFGKFLDNGNASDTLPLSIPTAPLSPLFLMTANVEVGTPPTTYELLVDTGSSNFVVGADLEAGPIFVKTSSTRSLNETVSVSYGTGFFTGIEVNDIVTLGGIPPVTQSLGVPNVSEGFYQFDGIIGLGLSALTVGTLLDEPDTPIPTITDTLHKANIIPNDLAALTVPLITGSQAGAIDFGAPDSTKTTSIISYAPLIDTGETAGFWSVLLSVTYGSGPATASTQLVSGAAGVMDVGTSLLLLPTEAFQQYALLTNATLDPISGLLAINNSNVDKLQSLFFSTEDASFEFTPNAQLFPRSLTEEAGLDSSMTYLIISDGDTAAGGLDFICGFVFLERYYSVFDTTNKQVGLAHNAQTFDITN